MSISQVTQGALADPAPDKHHTAARTARERAAAAAEKERQIGQRPRRTAQDTLRSYEAFERAQQLESKEHPGAAGRIAKGMSDATSVPAEGDPLEPIAAGSSMKAAAVAATAGSVASTAPDPKTSDANAAQSPSLPRLPQDNPAQTARNEATATTATAQPTHLSSTPPAAPEVEPAHAGSTVTVGKLVDTQLTTSTEGGYAQHYGSFPVLVAGQLVELDLYTLGQKMAGTPDNVRRLFLSLNSTSLGPVQVTAELSQSRLNVFVEGAVAKAAPEALNEHVNAVGELASRLGWKFESIGHAADLPVESPGSDGLDRLL